MRIKEVMKPVRTIDHELSVRKAAELMDKLQIGSIVVTNSNKAKGIITERDLTTKVTAENKIPSKVKIKDVMSTKLISIESDASLDDAVYLMIKHKVKKLPVIDGHELLGIITATDVVKNSDEVGDSFFFD